MTVRECEKEFISVLTRAGVNSPGLCVTVLLEQVLGLSRLGLALSRDRQLSYAEYCSLRELILRRSSHEPLAYITGTKDFFEHKFLVSPHVLIPRQETELIVELALKFINKENIVFLDAGCGCGNIGLSLLARRKGWRGLLLDKSLQALEIASKNAMNIAPDAIFVQGNMYNLPLKDSSLDLVVSNPPYIGLHEKKDVMRDVLDFEPHSALFSDEGGFGHLKALGVETMRCLKKGGILITEHGSTQQKKLEEIYKDAGFKEIMVSKDLAGLPRTVLARK